jgi:hypothetical protein
MSIMRIVRAALIMTLVMIHVTSLFAGGPLEVSAGSAVIWDTAHGLSYKLDDGPLGQVPEREAAEFVAQAFEKWARVPTASLRFASQRLGEDVKTSIRYLQLEGNVSAGSLVILDNEGGIVEALFGVENKDKILGFASPRLSEPRSKITRFVALLNGRIADNRDTVRSTLVHEIGHALGLDHAQINFTFAGDGDTGNDQFLPTMFPTSTDDDATLIDLNPDDMAWISRLYPNGEFAKNYGTIRGRLIRSNGQAVLGANVIAIGTADGRDDLLRRFSCVSDYLIASDGAFEIHVTPGTYKLRVEPIKRDFVNGSSVGPHAQTPSGQSFKRQVRQKTFPTMHSVAAGTTIDIGAIQVQ